MLRLPGLIDPHVHLRDPGATHKEDWDSGTASALAGGFTCVLAMPNTLPPIIDGASLAVAQEGAQARARCDYGIYLGATTDNAHTVCELAKHAAGLKMYLDQTFGTLRLDDLGSMVAHAERWPADRPLVCHAEGRTMAAAILAAHLAGRPIHICHVSRKDEIELIRAAKDRGWDVTCEVTPHHLFLSRESEPSIGPGRAEVRPSLASEADRLALRANLDIVDCFATDHAPHTAAEKDSAEPPPGFPGLETALALYLGLVRDDVLTMDELIERAAHNPRRIFGLPEQPDTWVEVDAEADWVVHGRQSKSRCGWTPFEGWWLRGRVNRVVLRGQVAYDKGRVLAPPGSGRDVRA